MRQVYRTNDEFTIIFGKGYSKFYEAFQQGVVPPQATQTVTNTVPAKRVLCAPSMQASKRIRQDDSASLPQMDQSQDPTISAQQSVANTTEAPTRANASEVASPPSNDRESSVRPRPRSYSATKGKFISMIVVLRILFALFRKLDPRSLND